MDWAEAKEAKRKSLEVLDTIDFIPFIKLCDGSEIDILREKMSNKYNYTELTNNEFMHGYLFNVIGDNDLIEYLRERYDDITIYEDTCYTIRYKHNDIPKNQVVEDFMDKYDTYSMTLQEIIEEAIKYGKEEAKQLNYE